MYDDDLALTDAERERRKQDVHGAASAPTTQALRASWNLDPARLRLTDRGWRRPTTPRSARRPRTTNWCRPSRPCSRSVGGDWQRFYAEAKRLAALPKAERQAILRTKESPHA